jgi:hypothetical protein
MSFQCPDCNQNFKNKRSLSYHMDHNVCGKKQKKCEKCNKNFSSNQRLMYHIENEVCEKKIQRRKLRLKKQFIEKYNNYTKEELILKLANIEGKYESLQENPQNIQNNINNVVVFPAAYGKEDIDYICQKLGDILGPLVVHQTFQSIPYLFEKIHKNKQLPQYHNVYTTSEKSSYALVSDGENFNNRPKKTVIDQIIEDKRSILNSYVDSNEKQLGKQVLDKYEKYQNKLDSDSSFRRNLELEIGGLLLDMKSIIADDEKTRHLLEKVNDGNFELDS